MPMSISRQGRFGAEERVGPIRRLTDSTGRLRDRCLVSGMPRTAAASRSVDLLSSRSASIAAKSSAPSMKQEHSRLGIKGEKGAKRLRKPLVPGVPAEHMAGTKDDDASKQPARARDDVVLDLAGLEERRDGPERC